MILGGHDRQSLPFINDIKRARLRRREWSQRDPCRLVSNIEDDRSITTGCIGDLQDSNSPTPIRIVIDTPWKHIKQKTSNARITTRNLIPKFAMRQCAYLTKPVAKLRGRHSNGAQDRCQVSMVSASKGYIYLRRLGSRISGHLSTLAYTALSDLHQLPATTSTGR